MKPCITENKKDQIKVTFEIEYIDDFKTWQQFLHCCENKNSAYDPWDYFKTITFNNFSEAMNCYTLYYLQSSNIFYVKMFCTIEDQTGNVRQEIVEFENTFYSNAAGIINSEMFENREKQEKTIKNLEKENKIMHDFINCNNTIKSWFKQFIERRDH